MRPDPRSKPLAHRGGGHLAEDDLGGARVASPLRAITTRPVDCQEVAGERLGPLVEACQGQLRGLPLRLLWD